MMASSASSPGVGGVGVGGLVLAPDPPPSASAAKVLGGPGGSPSSNSSSGGGHNHHGSSSSASHSLAIRQEIQRFESVHPSIYAIYDLIELIPDPLLAQQVREHVVCIEDSFVNSQEWTLSRGVPDLRLGIVGSLSSGKSALVHRYLTGSYMQEESPEGGRFKKEVVVDGQSFLLLIRDEGGPPEAQFSSWVDAVIFVFSLENEASFGAVYNYFAKMSQLRNMLDVPVILVGTQDAISDARPRVVDEARARKLAADLRPRCAYYETCATYGLNVERVFQDACHKITTAASFPLARPMTPSGGGRLPPHQSLTTSTARSLGGSFLSSPTGNGFAPNPASSPVQQQQSILISQSSPVAAPSSGMNSYRERSTSSYDFSRISTSSVAVPPGALEPKFAVPLDRATSSNNTDSNKENSKDGPGTPTNTPTSARKNRRRSNLFTPSKKTSGDSDRNSTNSNSISEAHQPSLGSGRSIPVRQGYLYKKSAKGFSKEWKKKYVTLCDDGRMTYHPSLHDYMENIHGKEIPLQYVTVKVPGQKPRGSRSIPGSNNNDQSQSQQQQGGMMSGLADRSGKGEKVLLTGYEPIRDNSNSVAGDEGDGGGGAVNGNAGAMPSVASALDKLTDTPNVKKRHRRIKSNGVKAGQDCEDPDVFEFHIVSLDNKQWYFDASSAEERDEWVTAIEQQILSSLQGNESNKKGQRSSAVDLQTMKRIKNDIPGNLKCVDCDAPNPDWASLNLGALICIECSGIHRQLGSHISRVRSLDLDEWPPGHLSVMVALGNRVANSVWEAQLPATSRRKPAPNSPPDEKERYIKAKYAGKEFLAPPASSRQQPSAALVEAVGRSDVRAVMHVLAHVTSADDVNASVSPMDGRTPLHLAAAMGNLAITQLLIWANANVKALDNDGRTSVTHARMSGCQELVELLLANGCPDVGLSGTLPRRKNSGLAARKVEMFDKIASSVL